MSLSRQIERRGDLASRDLDYPFPRVSLCEADCAYVAQCLASFEAIHRPPALDDSRCEALRHVAEIFVKHCSARAPRRDGLRLIAYFVYVALYIGDRLHHPGYRDLLQSFWAAIQGTEPSTNPAAFMATELICQLDEQATELAWHRQRFVHQLGMSLSAYLWLFQNRRRVIADKDEFLRARVHAIFTLPYLTLWRVLLRVPTSIDLVHGIAIDHLERSSAILIALANDLCSLERDFETGKQNMALIVAKERGVDLCAAKGIVRAMHDKAIAEHTHNDRLLRMALVGSDKAIICYLDFLQICIQGNLSTMRDLPRRYASRPGRLPSVDEPPTH